MSDIPEWATKEICRRTYENHERFMKGNLSVGITRLIRVAAEILAEHEEPPVDPLLEVITEAYDEVWAEEGDLGMSRADICRGLTDKLRKRGIEIGDAK